MKKEIIKMRDVWKIYDLGEVKVTVLRGIDLNVHEKEFLAVMGPSGSGKSTAMNLIGCLDIPSKGDIFLENHDIAKLHESDLAQIRGRTIGFVFQQFNLINSLNALENVMLPMIFQGMSAEKRKERALNLLSLVGLSDRIKHKPGQLSGGEQQRVAIARALANDPDIILADEPTGNLDTKTGGEIMKLLVNLHEKQNKTIVLITHDKYVAKFAERIVHLRDGRIVKDGMFK